MSGNIKEYIKYIARGISPLYDNDGIVVLNQKCIRNQKISLEESRIHNIHKKSVSEDKILQNFDVLINSTGVGTLGRVAQVKNIKDKITVDSHITIVRPNLEKINGEFFGYCIKVQEDFIETLGTGATGQTELSRDAILDNVVIPHYSKENQRKIAKVLSNYDDLIENNNKRIKILEEMAQKIYKEWFVDFNYPGHETATFKDTELGKIPSDWRYTAISDVLACSIGGGWGNEIKSGEYTESAYVIRGTDIPNCRNGNIQNCPLRYHTQSNIKSRLLQENDIIFEVSGGSKGQPVGRSLLLNKYLFKQFSDNVICASFCKLLRVDSKCASPEYVYLHLLNIYKNGEIEKYQTQSTGIINFKFTVFLEKEQILIPNNNILHLFNTQIIPLFDKISLLGYQNSILKQTRDLLLPRLMSGEIDVENLEIA